MAFLKHFTCAVCGQEKKEIHNAATNTCSDCTAKLEVIKENAHLDALSLQPLPTRIRKIEEQLYRLDIASRLKALESHHIRY